MKEDFIEDVTFDLFSVEDITFDLFSVELVIADVAILSMIQDKLDDLQANKADRETTYTKSEVEQIKLELLDLIYAGL